MRTMLSKALREFMSGPLNQLLVNLGGDDSDEWERELKHFLRKEKCWIPVVKKAQDGKVYLRRLYETSFFTLNSCTDGIMAEENLRKVFNGYVDPMLLNIRSKVTPAVKTILCELVEDGKFMDFLGKTAGELESRRIQFAQVVEFADDSLDFLRHDGYATLFVCTIDGEPVAEDLLNVFVASVYISAEGQLYIYRRKVSSNHTWYPGDRSRIVCPQP